MSLKTKKCKECGKEITGKEATMYYERNPYTLKFTDKIYRCNDCDDKIQNN